MKLSRNSGGRKVDMQWTLPLTLLTRKQSPDIGKALPKYLSSPILFRRRRTLNTSGLD